MPRAHTKYQFFLYEKFIGGQHNIIDTSRKILVPASTLYNYAEGVSTCPVDLVAPFYNSTNDPDFLNFIINDTDLMLVPKKEGKGEKTVLEETLDVSVACGNLTRTVQKALKDKEITRNEGRLIVKAINEAEKELEDLRKKID